MIDWLELLWLAAEEAQLGLPAEVTFPTAAKVTEEELPSAERPEEEVPGRLRWGSTPGMAVGESSVRTHWGGTPGMAEGENRPEPALFERLRGRNPDFIGAVATENMAVRRSSRKAADLALTALYRRVRESVSSVLPGSSGGRGRVTVREEISAAPGLTEAGLDRSLRRDSRRYDGGMSIY